MNLSIFLTLVVFLSQLASASEVSVEGKSYINSCGYYSNTIGEFKITYKNAKLPWGTKVQLVSALSGKLNDQTRLEWQYRAEVDMPAVDSFLWGFSLVRIQHHRSASVFFDQLVFVFHVTLPTGQDFYDNGSSQAWSFYATNFPENPHCTTSLNDRPPYTPLEVMVINR